MSNQWDDMIKAFKRRNIICEVVVDRQAALERTKQLVEPGCSVSFVGSRTVHQCGIHGYFRDRAEEFKLYDPYRPEHDWAKRVGINLEGMRADWIIGGANAITKAGEIVNLDGIGNRVGGYSFGPKRVLILAGHNKIVDDLGVGIKRVREIAAPLNSKRLKLGNPCEEDGICHDCSEPQRICREWGIIEGQMDSDRMKVLIIKEDLGF
jgi:hypothetical protein